MRICMRIWCFFFVLLQMKMPGSVELKGLAEMTLSLTVSLIVVLQTFIFRSK